jgi:hypothetical protein
MFINSAVLTASNGAMSCSSVSLLPHKELRTHKKKSIQFPPSFTYSSFLSFFVLYLFLISQLFFFCSIIHWYVSLFLAYILSNQIDNYSALARENTWTTISLSRLVER